MSANTILTTRADAAGPRAHPYEDVKSAIAVGADDEALAVYSRFWRAVFFHCPKPIQPRLSEHFMYDSLCV